MNPSFKLVDIFDAATKVTSPLALGAFAIAAIIAILWIWLSTRMQAGADEVMEGEEQHAPMPSFPQDVVQGVRVPPAPAAAAAASVTIPKAAWILLGFAILVPTVAWAFVATHSDLPYEARVLVVDKLFGLVNDPRVVCSVGGGQSKFEGGVQFEIPPANLPSDKTVTFFATTTASHGEKSVVFGKTRSVSVRIDIAAAPPAPIPVPAPSDGTSEKQPATAPPPSPKKTVIDSSWIGTYQSVKKVSEHVVSTYAVAIQKDGITIRENRTEDDQAVCNAEWKGPAKQTMPQVLSFTVSRANQIGYFCQSYSTPETLSGTISRSGYHAIAVNAANDPRWVNITLR